MVLEYFWKVRVSGTSRYKTPKYETEGTKMAKASNKERSMALYESILELKSVEECCRFFDDLCTVGELRAMEQRFEVAVLLNRGMIYNDILERTGASSATISRVNRSLQYGADGYQAVLPRIKEQMDQHGV